MLNSSKARTLLRDLSAHFDRLRPQSIRPAEGSIKHDYLIPGGFYKQMWDWDGFFIGCHLASRGPDEAQYLKWWALNFIELIDEQGYVCGCITTKGPRLIFGKFAMKPFLCQGAYFASRALNDFSWIAPVYDGLKKVLAYREATQLDPAWNLFYWDNAIQSGADNNPALTNDEHDRCAVLATDLSTFQLREYLAMAAIAENLHRRDEAALYESTAQLLSDAIVKHMWFGEESSFFNIRRDTRQAVRRVSYSNFIPLIQKLVPPDEGRRMISTYLWNRDHMLAGHGLRSLSKQDPQYNNECMIIPYSNWQGPVWPVANFLYTIALKRYGFDEEAGQLAATIGELVLRDILSCGTMHENYHADTGVPLAPTAEQSEGGVFTGFVGWNLLVQNILEGVAENRWLMLEL